MPGLSIVRKINFMVTHYTFDSGKQGHHLIILGAIHGDEPCGTIAINKAMDQLNQGTLKLTSGKVTFFPMCNPKAYEQKVRYIDDNLNRIFKIHESPSSYEEKLSTEICSKILELNPTAILDLHSFSGKGEPFGFLDNDTPENRKFSFEMNEKYIITGWDTAFGEVENPSYCTESFARDNNIHCILVECGQNHTKEAEEFAIKTLYRGLSYWNLIDEFEDTKTAPSFIEMKHVITKEAQGELLIPHNNFVKCQKGQTIAAYGPEKHIEMPFDGYVILPKFKAEVGHEWFYIGA